MRLEESGPKQIYAMLADNGKVKIGVSNNVPRRKDAIERKAKVTIVKVYSTQEIERTIVFQLETKIRKRLDAFLDEESGREWFYISFEDAIKVINDVLKKSKSNQNPKGDYYKYRFLIARMIEKNIDYDVLAKIVKMPSKSLRQCVSGKREFRLSEAIRIRNIIEPNMSLDELFAVKNISETQQ